MTTRVIRLSTEDINSFVNAATACDFDVDIATKNYTRSSVDAKSVLGIMTLDLRGPLVVSYNGSNEHFEQYLKAHATASPEG